MTSATSPEKTKGKTGPKSEPPGHAVGHDCGYVTVKLPPGGQVELVVWAKSRRLTLRALFAQALHELLDAPPDDLTVKMGAIEDQDRISVLIPMRLSEELGAFVEARSLNRQTVAYRAIYEYRNKRAP